MKPEQRDMMRRDIESGQGTFSLPDPTGRPNVVVMLDAYLLLDLLDQVDELEGRR